MIRLSLVIGGSHWEKVILFIQWLMLVVIALIFMKVSENLFNFYWAGVLPALLIGLDPSMHHWSNAILAEMALSFVITLVWFVSLSFLNVGEHLTRKHFVLAITIGVLSGFACLIKPVWIVGFLPLVIAFMIMNYKRFKNTLILCSIIVGMHVVVILPWLVFLKMTFNQSMISRTATVNLNLITIRAGMTKYSSGTPLYSYLEKERLLEKASSVSWEDFDQFTDVKNTIDWESRTDPLFYRAAFFEKPGVFIRLFLKRYPKFFTNRPVALVEGGFRYLPGSFRYFYEGSYNWFFKYILPFLLFGTLLLAFKSSRLRPMIVLSFAILFYQSVIVVFVSYYDQHFTRMRVSVEPILLFMAAIPILWLFNRFLWSDHFKTR